VTAAVTNLSAQYVASPPGITLTFDSASAPDSFTFLVDGVPTDTDIEADDIHVAGTTYSYTVARFRPNVLQSFGVAAVDDTDGASELAEVTYQPRVSGLWLVEADRSRWLHVAGTSGSDFTLGEDSTVHTPLGSRSGVRVTQGLRGYEGTVSGVLVAPVQYGRTLQEWVDEAYAMRAEPGVERILMVGTESFDCTIGYLNVRPTGDSTPTLRPISFTFESGDQRFEAAL
jgi:hypothetical protein